MDGAWTPCAGLTLGVIAADFLSGLVHWGCDRFFSAQTPVIGAGIIAPFRKHHGDPQGIASHGLLELHGNSCLPAIGVLLVERCAMPLPEHAGELALHWALLSLALAVLATNQFHLWAHVDSPPAPARWLQRSGLILSRERHALHHQGRFAQSFCMTTGWLNPLLDRIDFFGRLEAQIRRLQQWAR
jgi:ubiquitin-conjugating enzyme E2 variant